MMLGEEGLSKIMYMLIFLSIICFTIVSILEGRCIDSVLVVYQ